jgi:hypothetical protein
MYDLVLCVLATTKNNRLSQFSKIGHTKTNKYKYKIVYLVDNEEKPVDLVEEWYNCPNYHHSTRLIYYLKNTNEKSRWFMQVDDDSCTDIEKTIDLLDYFYDSSDSIMLTGSSSYFLNVPRYLDRTLRMEMLFSHTIDPKLQQVLKDMRIKNLFIKTDDLNKFEVVPRLCHGWEQNVFSNRAFEKIKKYNRTQEFLESCSKNKPEFSDEVPFLFSKIAKIPISQCCFFSPLPDIEEYTAINNSGRFSHIHHMTENLDLTCHLEKIIKNNIKFNEKKEIEEYLESNIENSEWIFFHINNDQIISRCAIKFNENKTISVSQVELSNEFKINLNYEKYELENKKWQLENKNIKITNVQNQSIVFSKTKDKMYIANLDDQIYILSKLSPIDRVYWNHKMSFGINSRVN